MSRCKKVLRNVIILVILFGLFMYRAGFYLTPISAHEHSERSIHYGPSEVVHIEDFDEGKYILGKYDKWVSCNTVNRELFFFWGFGNFSIGSENDTTKLLTYNWDGSHDNLKIYGIINDDSIKRVEVILNNGETLTQSEFYEGLFLLTWKADLSIKSGWFKEIRGYDSNDIMVFQSEEPN